MEEWVERIGYCFHKPICTDSAVCRAKRAQERATSTKPKVYTGEAAAPRKLDFDE
jgi:DNA-binding winged helix-turn-helix (wHTH) protein